jgi:hypothetical protein
MSWEGNQHGNKQLRANALHARSFNCLPYVSFAQIGRWREVAEEPAFFYSSPCDATPWANKRPRLAEGSQALAGFG